MLPGRGSGADSTSQLEALDPEAFTRVAAGLADEVQLCTRLVSATELLQGDEVGDVRLVVEEFE